MKTQFMAITQKIDKAIRKFLPNSFPQTFEVIYNFTGPNSKIGKV